MSKLLSHDEKYKTLIESWIGLNIVDIADTGLVY